MNIVSFNNYLPSMIFIFSSLFIPFLNNLRIKNFFVLLIPLIAIIAICFIDESGNNTKILSLVGFNLQTLFVYKYTKIFAIAFTIVAFGGALFGMNKVKPIEISLAFLYTGSSIGVLFSGDLITMFIFWELMAIFSTFLVFTSNYKNIGNIGIRYACAHFLGGILLMIGIVIHISISKDASIDSFIERASLFEGIPFIFNLSNMSVLLALSGVLINAATPPFSCWLTESYSKASEFSSVYLSAFTTKTSIFVLIRIFAGTDLLIYIGLFMMFYGVVYAILENDIRRILGYSIINQVGLMIIGVGIGSDIALYGTATHAFCHIMYKCLLFMCSGSVIYMTGKNKFSDLGGLYNSMGITAVCALIASATIFFTSFVSKGLIMLSIAKSDLFIEWFIVLALSIGVFIQAVIRYPWFLFFDKKSDVIAKDPPFSMCSSMILLAVICLCIMIPGVGNKILYSLLPGVPDYQGFSLANAVLYLQQLCFASLAFILMYNFLKPKNLITIDFDWFYRRLFRYIIYFCEKVFMSRILLLNNKIADVVKKIISVFLIINSPGGFLSRRWAMSTSLTLVLSMLSMYLFIYYFF